MTKVTQLTLRLCINVNVDSEGKETEIEADIWVVERKWERKRRPFVGGLWSALSRVQRRKKLFPDALPLWLEVRLRHFISSLVLFRNCSIVTRKNLGSDSWVAETKLFQCNREANIFLVVTLQGYRFHWATGFFLPTCLLIIRWKAPDYLGYWL